MLEVAIWIVLAAVIFMLILSVWRQCTLLGRRGQIADNLGILPQWKFFALSSMKSREDSFDDFHLLVRHRCGAKEAGQWQSIFWNDKRKWFHIVWNPTLRVQAEIQKSMMTIIDNGTDASTQAFLSSLSYLTLLRFCLDRVAVNESPAIQFAIVTSRGRDLRGVSVKYLSAWHSE